MRLDTVIFIENDNWKDLGIKINLGLSTILDWYTKNGLLLNFEQSVYENILLSLNKTNSYNQMTLIIHSNISSKIKKSKWNIVRPMLKY